MPDDDFQRIEEAFARGGSRSALEALAVVLERERKYPQLFEALLIQSRAALGLPLIPLGPLEGLSEEVLKPHEEAIAQACRRVGGLYLKQGDIAAAWPYFRALGETAPVAEAFQRIEPAAKRKDTEELADIAFHQGVNPRRGLEIILANSGICSAITAMERSPPPTRSAAEECAALLVRTLHRELTESVKSDIARREPGFTPAAAPPGGLPALIAGRPWLFHDSSYHVDPSHLWAVVRLSAALTPGPEIDLALEMTEYARHLAPIYHYKSDPPFEAFYADQTVYLRGRRFPGGPENEAAARHFRDKVAAARSRGEDRYPVAQVLEVLVNLGRAREAIDLLLESQGPSAGAVLGAPTLGELCQRAGEFARLKEVSLQRSDLVGFTVGLVQAAPER